MGITSEVKPTGVGSDRAPSRPVNGNFIDFYLPHPFRWMVRSKRTTVLEYRTDKAKRQTMNGTQTWFSLPEIPDDPNIVDFLVLIA